MNKKEFSRIKEFYDLVNLECEVIVYPRNKINYIGYKVDMRRERTIAFCGNGIKKDGNKLGKKKKSLYRGEVKAMGTGRWIKKGSVNNIKMHHFDDLGEESK